ncbi:hypothetical protein EMVG_00304 [Emiliania huxleyi virus PS401]|nr:hypothetical protein EMVG_00304 [Emiliania huxleyi virus PS401]
MGSAPVHPSQEANTNIPQLPDELISFILRLKWERFIDSVAPPMRHFAKHADLEALRRHLHFERRHDERMRANCVIFSMCTCVSIVLFLYGFGVIAR